MPCLLIIFLSVVGCEKQDKEMTPEHVDVKSFKIEKMDDQVKRDDSQVIDVNEKIEGQTNKVVSTPVDGPEAPTEMHEKNADGEILKSVTPRDDQGGRVTDEKSTMKKDIVISPALGLESDGKFDIELAYNPAGRIDPFEPLFQPKQESYLENTGKSQTIRDARRGKLTPLEKLDIGQLKLTAIIQGAQRSVAMVQESTGKGHVVKKGTYIGINSGRVVEISKNIVVIEEEVEDLLGKIIVRKRELKLQKPLGEM